MNWSIYTRHSQPKLSTVYLSTKKIHTNNQIFGLIIRLSVIIIPGLMNVYGYQIYYLQLSKDSHFDIELFH